MNPDTLQTLVRETGVLAQARDFPIFVGVFFFFLGFIWFATARTRARRHLDYLLRTFNTVTEKLNEAEKIGHFGSFNWDFEKNFKYWSQEVYNLFGIYGGQKVPEIGWITSTVPEKERSLAEEKWNYIQKTVGPFDITMHIIRPSGEEAYLQFIGKTKMTTAHMLGTVEGIVHDVTHEVSVDRAKTEFVSLASHQLKAPLTSIAWLAEALLTKKQGALTPDQEKYIDTMRQTSHQMMEMVNDLLNVSRIELGVLAIRPEDIDISAMVLSVSAEQRKIVEDKHITLTIDCSPEIPHMVADKSFLRMIFQNLLSNAVKYTPPNGIVRFEVSLAPTQKQTIMLHVSDTGIGIPHKEQINVFKKLYRATNAQNTVADGTGLGLYVIKSILERVGGKITFESIEGKGTTFNVTMPVVWQSTIPTSLAEK
ncbi:MAG: sensor hybrid histidine kinase [Candidatus Kaiserbacteria bacterium]|nr:sensor hybrid histidine kinase [Candidatus Kaiserbacteria bacterium]